MTGMRKWGKILIINLGIVAALLVVIEVGVRLAFPEIIPLGVSEKLFQKEKYGSSFGFAPDANDVAFGVNIKTDADGFIIDPTVPSKDHDKLPKIIIIGDSVAMGVGLEAKDSFPFLLQRKLSTYKIVNTSVIGYGTEDYANLLEALFKKGYDFEGAIVALCLNDISFFSKININKSFEEKNEEYRNIMFQNPFVRYLKKFSDEYFDFNVVLRNYSRTYLLIKNKVVDMGRGYFLADLEPYNKPGAERYIQKELKKINDLLFSHGKWAIFYLFPYEYQLRPKSQNFGNIDILKPQKMFNAAARKEKINLIDFYPRFSQKTKEGKIKHKSWYLYCDPMHFSKPAHQFIMENIYQDLYNYNLIKWGLYSKPFHENGPSPFLRYRTDCH
jgi:lysophospholipase L1-like esterase